MKEVASLNFAEQSMLQITAKVQSALKTHRSVKISVSTKAQERPLRAWLDLAEYLHCRFELLSSNAELRFLLQQTEGEDDWKAASQAEKYGGGSPFFDLRKFDEPWFLLDYQAAWQQIIPRPGDKVLNLGIHRGDEFSILRELLHADLWPALRYTGVDHSATALAAARQSCPEQIYSFFEHDLNDLQSLKLPRQQVIVSIGTLHSPSLESHNIFRYLIQELADRRCGIILGFPNCRYRDGERFFGARRKNFRRPEYSPLLRSVNFYKKYLQQHKFQTHLSGKYYWFLTAWR